MNLFSNDYLPDRLDIQDVNSIAYMEFIENQIMSLHHKVSSIVDWLAPDGFF